MDHPAASVSLNNALLPHWGKGLGKGVRALVDMVLPPRCAGCGVIVAADGGFCPDCWTRLDFLDGPACARCDVPLPIAQGEGALCGQCMADPPPYSRVRAPLAYDALSRDIVMRLKYGRRQGMARLMARVMANVLPPPDGASSGEGDVPALLVPVPLHRWRLWSRGFNQSVEVARHLARLRALPLAVDALERTRRTPSLRGLGRTQRAKAVRGAFRINPQARALIDGRDILLVDDVFTSGATAGACARTLLKGGARSVEVVAFARVLDRDGPGGEQGWN